MTLASPAPRAQAAQGRPSAVAAVSGRRVQALRGLACLLLVFFHVVGGAPDDGLRVSDDTVLRKLMDFLLYLRMPIFAFLSGYVYAMRPMHRGEAGAFLRGKVRRLLIPLVVVSTFFFVVWHAFHASLGQAAPQIWRIYLFSYEIYWFLQAMVVIFLVVAALESAGGLDHRAGVVAIALAAFAASRPLESVDLLSIGGALYLAPYFLAGLAARRFELERHVVVLTLASGVLAIGLIVHGWRVITLPHGQSVDRTAVLGLFIGCSASLLLLRALPSFRWLERVGNASFAIFLFHIFFVTAMREGLSRTGAPLGLMIAAGVLAGVGGPIALEAVLKENRAARRIFLGLR